MISRRSFLKCSGVGLTTSLLPNFALSKLSSSDVSVLEIFLYGGASSAVAEAKLLKDENISGYNNVTLTTNGFWQEAGGDHLETLLAQKPLIAIFFAAVAHFESTRFLPRLRYIRASKLAGN